MLFEVRDMIVCRKEHGLPLPDGLDEATLAQLDRVVGWLWHTLYSHDEFCYNAFHDGIREVAAVFAAARKVWILCFFFFFHGRSAQMFC